MYNDIERPSGVSLKKQAYHKLIRNEQIQKQFAETRQNLLKKQCEYHRIHEDIDKMLMHLPEAGVDLLEVLNEEFSNAAPYILRRVEQVGQGMVKAGVVGWSALTRLVSKLLVSTGDSKEIERIVKCTLLPTLENALILSRQYRNSPTLPQIMRITLMYCFRLGRYVYRLNIMQQKVLIEVLVWLWNSQKEQFQDEEMLLMLIYNILSTKFDQQQEENISPSDMFDLDHFKMSVISGLFYRENGREMEMFMGRLCMLAMREGGDKEEMRRIRELLNLYLRIVVNITFFLSNAVYFYPMLANHLLLGLSSIFFLENHKALTTILAIRVLNNLLVSDILLTDNILKEVKVTEMMKFYRRVKEECNTRREMIEMFMNLLHYRNDDGGLIQELSQLGVGEVVMELFEMEEEDLGEDSFRWGVNSLIILYEHSPRKIKKLVIEQDRTLKMAMERCPYQSDAIEDLFACIYPQYKQEQVL